MQLTLSQGDFENWYIIEKAIHDGREWCRLEPNGGLSFQRSARVSDAEVEGTLAEMIEIAAAIRDRGGVAFKRCAVLVDTDNSCAYFWSPRNSQKRQGVSLDDADNLAGIIEEIASKKLL